MTFSADGRWEVVRLGDVATIYSGGTPSRSVPAYWGGDIPWVTTSEIDFGHISSARQLITQLGLENSAARIAPAGTVLLAMYGQGKTRGKSAILSVPAAMNQACAAIEVRNGLDAEFLLHYLTAHYGDIRAMSNAGSQENLSGELVRKIEVVLPSMAEQKRIASALTDSEQAIEGLVGLLAKKRAIRQGLMQGLLTGRTRLGGFSEPWQRRRVADVLAPRTERNSSGEPLEVLSCTKDRGFVRSLDFFKSQVFSRDLSNYRVIYRGDVGYPANHIEEGSIGIQELFDRALVSPIYVVMRAIGENDPFFLQRQMKLDSFRQKFARATNASVDRRGSLRWGEFSQIEVDVPAADEQKAIVCALRDADAEIDALERRLEAARAIKQGMMQELLTGRTRLVPTEATA